MTSGETRASVTRRHYNSLESKTYIHTALFPSKIVFDESRRSFCVSRETWRKTRRSYAPPRPPACHPYTVHGRKLPTPVRRLRHVSEWDGPVRITSCPPLPPTPYTPPRRSLVRPRRSLVHPRSRHRRRQRGRLRKSMVRRKKSTRR